ncbi:hypothetical protein KPATCC21470_5627 [Kitasatospora purpeofusca]
MGRRDGLRVNGEGWYGQVIGARTAAADTAAGAITPLVMVVSSNGSKRCMLFRLPGTGPGSPLGPVRFT